MQCGEVFKMFLRDAVWWVTDSRDFTLCAKSLKFGMSPLAPRVSCLWLQICMKESKPVPMKFTETAQLWTRSPQGMNTSQIKTLSAYSLRDTTLSSLYTGQDIINSGKVLHKNTCNKSKPPLKSGCGNYHQHCISPIPLRKRVTLFEKLVY